jgi:hypothetical protein
MNQDRPVTNSRQPQEKIIKDFRNLYLDIKRETGGHQEARIPELVQGRKAVTQADEILRREQNLGKKLAAIIEQIDKADSNSAGGLFLPCFARASKTSLLETKAAIEYELQELDPLYTQKCQEVFKLYCAALMLKDRLYNPAASRTNSLAPVII